jgi:hypothetical protein
MRDGGTHITRIIRCFSLFLALASSSVPGLAQTAGDYRTINSGTWTTDAIWERFNGSTWASVTRYPGEIAGTGNVTVRHTVTLNVSPSNAIGSLVIQADLLQSNTNNNRTLNVTGNLSVSSGTLNLSSRVNYRITLNVGGNVTMTGGVISETANTYGELIFNGSGMQTFTKSGGTISNDINFTVNPGATLDLGTSVLDGSSGTFTLSPGATLRTAHQEGISSSGNTGSIQVTGTRLFDTGANYVYNGTQAQITGTGLPATVNNLVTDNPAGITLTGNATVSNILTMTQGNIATGSNTLALSGSSEGSLSHASGTVTGKFRRAISTTAGINYLFPVGTASFYRPARLVFSSLSSSVNITAEFLETAPDGFVSYTDGGETLNNTFSEGYWRFFSSALRTASYSVTLTGNDFTSYSLDDFTRITARDNSNTTWRASGSHGTVSGNDVSRTGLTTLNTTSFDFALATCYTPVFLGYKYERNITVDHNRVAGGEDLYNFPVMISLAGQNYLKTAPNGQVYNSSGYDIIFADENYNQLDHQVEYYSGTNGDLIAWVRIPVLSSSSNTVIKIIYGNPLVTDDPSVTTVWDSHYKGVWHLDDNNLKDFTSYNKSGTPYNSPTYPSGRINNALGLNGSNQYVQVNNASNLNFAGNITVSAWVYMNAANRDQKIASNQNNSSGGYKFGIYTNNKVEFEIRNSSNVASLNRDVSGGTVLSTGNWYYLAGISSDVLDSIKTFVNGVSERPFKKTGILGVASNNLVVGKEPFDPLYYFSGRFDELRISDKVRSDGWLRTEYNNQSSPSTFYSVDADGTETNNLPSAGYCSGSVTLDFGYPAGGTYSGNPYISGNTFTPPSPGTYTITYDYVGGCGPTSISKDIVITGTPDPPVADDKEYCQTEIAYLEASSGQNIRWYSGGTLVSTANPFSTGQTTPGTYDYTVTQTVNGCESDPEPVTLTIYGGITISSHPQAAVICQGSNAVFTVSAAGLGLGYRWQENGVNLSDGGVYSGTTTATLTLTNPGIALSGRNYRCVITTGCGSSATSNAALLTVNTLPVATFSYAGSPYCPNAANPLPSFSGGGSAGVFSSSPAGMAFVSTATGQINIAASTPGTYTVTNTIAPAGGCGEVSASSTVEIISTLTWSGAVSNDWNSTGNWSCGMVPGTALTVVIPNVANKPVISAGQTADAGNITIESGSSLTVSSGTIRISGSVTNNGTFTASDGNVVMNGTTAQSLGAGIFSGNTVKNLTVDNPAGVTLLGPLGVRSVVLVQNGSLASDGNLTLLSDASQTALIDGSGTGPVTGNVTMQRYFSSGFGYKYISSPFLAATVNELSDDMDLSYMFPLFYRFDENSSYSGWIDYTTGSDPLDPLAGYAVNFGELSDPKTIDITGVVSDGSHSLTLYNHDSLFTEGFNLVGNPYPSPVNWNATGWTKTNIDNALYYFRASATDQYGGTYSTYINGVSSDGEATNIIPSMQGFFVHVSDGTYPVSGTLGTTNSVRINDLTHPFLKSVNIFSPALLRVTAAFTDDAASEDPAVIYFDNDAEKSFDPDYDALKLFNTDMMVTNLYSVLTSGKKLSINALPWLADTTLFVPLGLTTYRDGEVNFKMNRLENIPAGVEIFFHDALAGTRMPFTQNTEYKVSLKTGEYNNRFSLVLTGNLTAIDEPKASPGIFEAYFSSGIIKTTVLVLEGGEGVISIFDSGGRLLFLRKVYDPGHYDLPVNIRQGLYIVRYTTGKLQSGIKLILGI